MGSWKHLDLESCLILFTYLRVTSPLFLDCDLVLVACVQTSRISFVFPPVTKEIGDVRTQARSKQLVATFLGNFNQSEHSPLRHQMLCPIIELWFNFWTDFTNWGYDDFVPPQFFFFQSLEVALYSRCVSSDLEKLTLLTPGQLTESRHFQSVLRNDF